MTHEPTPPTCPMLEGADKEDSVAPSVTSPTPSHTNEPYSTTVENGREAHKAGDALRMPEAPEFLNFGDGASAQAYVAYNTAIREVAHQALSDLQRAREELFKALQESTSVLSSNVMGWKQRAESAEAALRQAEEDVGELNNILRAAGWGQGEIDSAAEAIYQAEREARRVREILFPEPKGGISDDAYYNLMGALHDMKQQNGDKINIMTVERVMGQLDEARRALGSVRREG